MWKESFAREQAKKVFWNQPILFLLNRPPPPKQIGLAEYSSVVYYKTGSPNWKETIRLNIQPEDFVRYHLFFTLQTTNQKKGAKVSRNPLKKGNCPYPYSYQQ